MAKESLGQQICDRVASEAMHHIDKMYPGCWVNVPTTARTSIANTIKSETRKGLDEYFEYLVVWGENNAG